MQRETRKKQGPFIDTNLHPTNQVPGKEEEKHEANDVSLDKEKGVKTLGVSWNPNEDTIYFQIKFKRTDVYMKRTILSNISRLFDPLNLAAAVTIKARIALQEIWKMKNIGWDDPLPTKLQLAWEKLFDEIEDLTTVQFPRCLQPKDSLGLPELHVFADASILAYGAVAYLVCYRSPSHISQSESCTPQSNHHTPIGTYGSFVGIKTSEDRV
jgi:hypothetical protein